MLLICSHITHKPWIYSLLFRGQRTLTSPTVNWMMKRGSNSSSDSRSKRTRTMDQSTDNKFQSAHESNHASPGNVIEVSGDLFSCPTTHSLAHCISADVKMGRGIAVTFKNRFKGISELLNQNQGPGGLAILNREQRFVYYLVTKEKYWEKPTYDTLRSSLERMRDHNVKNGVENLCMPKIGCGLDKLQWYKVLAMIREIYKGLDINITIYHFDDGKKDTAKERGKQIDGNARADRWRGQHGRAEPKTRDDGEEMAYKGVATQRRVDHREEGHQRSSHQYKSEHRHPGSGREYPPREGSSNQRQRHQKSGERRPRDVQGGPAAHARWSGKNHEYGPELPPDKNKKSQQQPNIRDHFTKSQPDSRKGEEIFEEEFPALGESGKTKQTCKETRRIEEGVKQQDQQKPNLQSGNFTKRQSDSRKGEETFEEEFPALGESGKTKQTCKETRRIEEGVKQQDQQKPNLQSGNFTKRQSDSRKGEEIFEEEFPALGESGKTKQTCKETRRIEEGVKQQDQQKPNLQSGNFTKRQSDSRKGEETFQEEFSAPGESGKNKQQDKKETRRNEEGVKQRDQQHKTSTNKSNSPPVKIKRPPHRSSGLINESADAKKADGAKRNVDENNKRKDEKSDGEPPVCEKDSQVANKDSEQSSVCDYELQDEEEYQATTNNSKKRRKGSHYKVRDGHDTVQTCPEEDKVSHDTDKNTDESETLKDKREDSIDTTRNESHLETKNSDAVSPASASESIVVNTPPRQESDGGRDVEASVTSTDEGAGKTTLENGKDCEKYEEKPSGSTVETSSGKKKKKKKKNKKKKSKE